MSAQLSAKTESTEVKGITSGHLLRFKRLIKVGEETVRVCKVVVDLTS